jgi:hypothetical protein
MATEKEIDPKIDKSASQLFSKHVAELDDWRGKMLADIRRIIHEADPDMIEEFKWKKPSNPAGIPVWSHNGIVCTGETYKNHVKMTFAKGASLKDPEGLFNAGHDGKVTRAIDFHEGDKINEPALKNLIRAAVELNSKGKK